MLPMTYRDIIRSYADGIEAQAYDGEVTDAKTRKFIVLCLRTASNSTTATVAYRDLTNEGRHAVVSYLLDGIWTANTALFVEYAGGAKAREAFANATERAVAILRAV